jgi:hypothetical protein
LQEFPITLFACTHIQIIALQGRCSARRDEGCNRLFLYPCMHPCAALDMNVCYLQYVLFLQGRGL